jgi:pyruvate,water dikinase
MVKQTDVRWFADLRSEDIATVGGKNAALGELYSALSTKGVKVPNGFALTADLYRTALTEAAAWPRLERLLGSIRPGDVSSLSAAAAEARSIVWAATGTARVRAAVGGKLCAARGGIR